MASLHQQAQHPVGLGHGLLLLGNLPTITNGMDENEIVKSMAECVLQSGWTDSNTVILKQLTHQRVLQQLTHLVKLSLLLADKGCYLAVNHIADTLSCLLFEMDEEELKNLTLHQMNVYFDFIINLQLDERTSKTQRVTEMPVIFSRFPPSRRLQFVRDLKYNQFGRIRYTLDGWFSYIMICIDLPYPQRDDAEVDIPGFVLPALDWLIRDNRLDLLNPFRTKICGLPNSGGYSRTTIIDAALLNSSKKNIKKLYKSSHLASYTVNRIIQARMQEEIQGNGNEVGQIASLPIIELAISLNNTTLDAIIRNCIFHLLPLPCVTLVINMAQKANTPVKRKRALQLLQIVQLYRKDSLETISSDIILTLILHCILLMDDDIVQLRALIGKLTFHHWEKWEQMCLFDTLRSHSVTMDEFLNWPWETTDVLLKTWLEKLNENPSDVTEHDVFHCLKFYVYHAGQLDAQHTVNEPCLSLFSAVLSVLQRCQLEDFVVKVFRKRWSTSVRHHNPIFVEHCHHYFCIKNDPNPSISENLLLIMCTCLQIRELITVTIQLAEQARSEQDIKIPFLLIQEHSKESIRTIEKHLLIQLIKEVAPLQDQHQIFTCVLLQYFTRADWNANEWQELQFILEQNNIKWDGNTQETIDNENINVIIENDNSSTSTRETDTTADNGMPKNPVFKKKRLIKPLKVTIQNIPSDEESVNIEHNNTAIESEPSANAEIVELTDAPVSKKKRGRPSKQDQTINRKKPQFGADDEQETKSKKSAAPPEKRKKPGRPTKKAPNKKEEIKPLPKRSSRLSQKMKMKLPNTNSKEKEKVKEKPKNLRQQRVVRNKTKGQPDRIILQYDMEMDDKDVEELHNEAAEAILSFQNTGKATSFNIRKYTAEILRRGFTLEQLGDMVHSLRGKGEHKTKKLMNQDDKKKILEWAKIAWKQLPKELMELWIENSKETFKNRKKPETTEEYIQRQVENTMTSTLFNTGTKLHGAKQEK